jgi:hypothetical protein
LNITEVVYTGYNKLFEEHPVVAESCNMGVSETVWNKTKLNPS